MSEVEIRMQAEMFSLVAEVNAAMVRVEGMKADNQRRLSMQESIAYTEEDFEYAACDIDKISQRLMKI